MMYTLAEISQKYKIHLETLKKRAVSRNLGTLRGKVKIFDEKEKNSLIDSSLYKVGKRKMEIKKEPIDLSKIRLNREKSLLFILYSLPVATICKTKLYKLLFLLDKEFNFNIGYDFFPYQYGPYSLELEDSINRMEIEGILLNINGFKLSSYLDVTSVKNKEKIQTQLEVFKRKYPSFFQEGTESLLKSLYTRYPQFAKRSNKKSLIDPALIPKEKTEAFFSTIGYEGKSLDYYVNQLLENDIKCLVDVRKNAWSQKKGFTGFQLEYALKRAKIEYIHIPTLGIESSERQELTSDSAYKELFINYSASLPKREDSLEKLYNIFKTRNRIAITCFEAEKHKCHRFYLAEYLAKQKGFKINHIEG